MYYLIFTGGEENELFDDMFADLRERENMRCIPDVPQVAGALRPLYRLHHARSLNRKRPLPFRGI